MNSRVSLLRRMNNLETVKMLNKLAEETLFGFNALSDLKDNSKVVKGIIYDDLNGKECGFNKTAYPVISRFNLLDTDFIAKVVRDSKNETWVELTSRDDKFNPIIIKEGVWSYDCKTPEILMSKLESNNWKRIFERHEDYAVYCKVEDLIDGVNFFDIAIPIDRDLECFNKDLEIAWNKIKKYDKKLKEFAKK